MAEDRALLAMIKPAKPITEMTPEERWAFAGEVAAVYKRRLEIARAAAEEES